MTEDNSIAYLNFLRIGMKAQEIDEGLSVIERMKLKRTTMNRVGIAFVSYCIIMGVLAKIL